MTRHTLVASFALLLLATQAFAQDAPVYAGFLPNSGDAQPANVFSERGFMTPEGLRPYEQGASDQSCEREVGPLVGRQCPTASGDAWSHKCLALGRLPASVI